MFKEKRSVDSENFRPANQRFSELWLKIACIIVTLLFGGCAIKIEDLSQANQFVWIIHIVDDRTGQPLPNVPIFLRAAQDFDHFFESKTTGETGLVIFAFPDKSEGIEIAVYTAHSQYQEQITFRYLGRHQPALEIRLKPR